MKFKTNVIFALFFLIFIVDFNAAKKIEKFLAGDVNDRILHRNVRDVNDSCDSRMLDGLDLAGLATKVNISQQCADLAAGIFARKFAHANPIRIGNELPAIDDLESASNIIRYFGHLITKLSLTFVYNVGFCNPYTKLQNQRLLHDIHEYCGNSLVELQMTYVDCDVGIFNEIKGPFQKTEFVKIRLFGFTQNTDNLKLNVIFPRVRHLDLDLQSITDPNFVDCEYRYLSELGIASGILDESFDAHLKGLLKKNQQITTVSVVSPTYRTFHHFYKVLKNLQELRIQESIRDHKLATQDKIFFSTLKRLHIELALGECVLPKNIAFGTQLNELTLKCAYVDIDNGYFDFLLKNKRIKKLTAGIDLNNRNLERLIGKFPILSEAEFTLKDNALSSTIIKFVQKSNLLNVLRIHHSSNDDREAFKMSLQDGVGDKFRVTYNNATSSSEYIIERKVPVGSAKTLFTFNLISVFITIFITHQFLV